MKNRPSLVVLFRFVVICVVLGLLYSLFIHNEDRFRTRNVMLPLPEIYQVDVLFKNVADISGKQQAVVNIVNGGKYGIPGENYTFDYSVLPTSFVAPNRVKNIRSQIRKKPNTQWEGYLKIHIFGEELSKIMRVFLALSNFPGFEKMKIVGPHFANAMAKSTGPTTFDSIFNLNELNQVLSTNGYPPVVLDKEYDDVCKKSKPIYVFDMYSPVTINGKLYNIKHIKNTQEGWIDCDSKKDSLRLLSVNITERKLICATKNFNISTLRQTLLKDVKCIELTLWGDHRLYRKEQPGRLSPNDIFEYVLNPSDMIVNEVNAFTERYLERPYVAIHMRAGHINRLPSTIDRCYKLAMKIVQALKERKGVKSVYLSTDMTKFGGRGAYYPGHEEYLAAISGAIRYTPNVTGLMSDISPTSVSMTNVLLLRKSDHLIAVGAGSFRGFVMSQFVREHFEKDPETWSLIRVCENARGGRFNRDPNIDYSKWITPDP